MMYRLRGLLKQISQPVGCVRPSEVVGFMSAPIWRLTGTAAVAACLWCSV